MSSREVAPVTPLELAQEVRGGGVIVLIDVRADYEWQLGRLPDALHIPLGRLDVAAGEFDRTANIVVYCHHGARSDLAARVLVAAGFSNVRNLIGGIDRWSAEVDQSVARY